MKSATSSAAATSLSAQSSHDAIESGLPDRLSDIVGDTGAFFTDVWGSRAQSFHCPAGMRLLSAAEIWGTLDCGLLVAPYFGILKDEIHSTASGVTQTRSVLNRPMPGYADAAAIRERIAHDYTLKLNQPEHWHPGIKQLVTGLREDFRAEVRSAVFLTPRGGLGLRSHADEAHVLVLQLEGQLNWHIEVPGSMSATERRSAETTLQPGDILYIPPGCRHHATTRGADSLHISITVQQPTVRDLAELALAGFMHSPQAEQIAGAHHLMTIDEKVSWLHDALAEHMSGLDLDTLLTKAVRIRQRDG